jgi:pimeloyl-ACP methyl ester carboxylesterase
MATNVANSELASVTVHGTELHYLDTGSGTPIIFVHGGLGDYRELLPLAEALPGRYRTVVYSRRHSSPNSNPPPGADGHMAREVADLAALIETLDLGPVHVAGASYGAFLALMLAIERPELVKSLVAAEPPLLHWLRGIDGGQQAYDDFYGRVMTPCRAAFAADEPERALRIAMDYFLGPGALDIIPADFRDMLLANLDDWRAITTAPDALPEVTREAIAAIRAPVMILSGSASAAVHRLIDPELLRVLPNAKRIIIDEGTHDMCVEQPGACAHAIDAFIARLPDTASGQ